MVVSGAFRRPELVELLLAAVLALGVTTATTARAADPDDYWSSDFSIPGQNFFVDIGALNGSVECVVEYNGSLVVGGAFMTAGGVSAPRIAAWNGSSWSSLGGGMDGAVYALATDGTNLYAAGAFSFAGGVAANRVAMWSGSSWSALGAGMDMTIRALALHSGDLVAGGVFTTAGGIAANQIARWDGTGWSPLGIGMDSAVYALYSFGGDLIAGGAFTTAGGTPAAHVARWNGSVWSPMGVGMNSWVSCFAVYEGDLVAGGAFSWIEGTDPGRIARWNGSFWSGMSFESNSTVHRLLEYAGSLIAVGDFTQVNGLSVNRSAVLSGGAWQQIPNATFQNSVHGLGIYQERPYFAVVNGPAQYWDAATLPVHPALGITGDVLTICPFSGTVAVSGTFQLQPWGSRRLDGDHWASLSTSGQAPEAYVLEVIDNQLLAGTANGVRAWDGSSWNSLGGPYPNFHSLALIEWNGQLVTGGAPDPYDANQSGVRVLVNGTWQSLGPNPPDGTVYALEIYQGELIAGGDFTNAGINVVNEIARFDGTSWGHLGNGFTDPVNGRAKVRALAVHDGQLVAGGFLPQTGLVTANGIARWNGTWWSQLGAGVASYVLNGNYEVLAMTVYNDNLIVGGRFGYAGGQPANSIARWNGTLWSTLGSGIGGWGPVEALGVQGGSLYVGGHFWDAGGKTAVSITTWTEPSATDTEFLPGVASLVLQPCVPNPFNPSTQARFSIPAPGPVRVTVLDVRGRVVATLFDGALAAGPHRVAWRGLGPDLRPASSGVYFLRVEHAGESRTEKAVLLK